MKNIVSMVAVLIIGFSNASLYAKEDDDSSRKKRQKRPDFTKVDINSDGRITLKEFSSRPIPFGDHETVFNNIDSDGDGSITEEEFINHKPLHRRKGERKKRE